MRCCELCCCEAVVFCPSDAAFLCGSCDAKVHQANFLVSRHLRQPIHQNSAFVPDSSSSSSSSICISTSRRAVGVGVGHGHSKVEAIFRRWCGKLGMETDTESCVEVACKGLNVCVDRWTVLPLRVSLAASMWLGLKLSLHNSKSALKRLQDLSGVPAKLILAAESKLQHAFTLTPPHLQEGWAETQT